MQKKQYSLHMILLSVCGVLLLTIALLGFVSIHAAARAIRQQTYEIANGVISTQAQRLKDDLKTIEATLLSYAYDSGDIVVLESGRRDTSAWFSAFYRLRQDFNNSVAIQIADNYFFYSPDETFFSARTGLSRPRQDAIENVMSGGLLQNRCWLSVNAEGEDYLICIQRVHNSYIGAWVSVDSVLKDISGSGGMDQGLSVGIADSSGGLLNAGGIAHFSGDYSDVAENGYQIVSENGLSYLLTSHSIIDGAFSLVAFVPDAALGDTAADYIRFVVPLTLGALCIIAVMLRSFWKSIIGPVVELTQAIRRLRAGDAEVQVAVSAPCVELGEMNTAFNEMVQEIRDLKIGVYEEQLKRQAIQIEYLKMQVTPHFLINCLNTVYQLTEAGQPRLTLQMVKGLSRHLRYMLDASVTVPLSQELEMVENYVELTGIRYPNSLSLHMDCQPEAMDAAAIPMLVLNFVENTVKHEAVLNRLLEIHVGACLEQSGEEKRLHITVWDTGGGFSPEMLHQLEDIPAFIKAAQNRHIGISNVFQRAQLIMGDCGFRFSNREEAGAQIDMDLPYTPYQERGDIHDAFDR